MTRTTVSQTDLAKRTQELVGAYLAGEISLGKVAEVLGVSRFELQDRFLRLGVPLHLGPATLKDAWAEIEAARSLP
jgi:predicted HTH domain antitoxin